MSLPYDGDGEVLIPQQEWDDETRAYHAQQLRTSGHDWKEIAEMAGYAGVGAAKVSVQTYLQRAALAMNSERKEATLELEMSRLDSIIKAYWPTAMAGEVKHAELILRVITQQSRMLGLEELSTKSEQGAKTIIIAGSTVEYAEALKQVVAASSQQVGAQVARVGEDEL